METGTTCLPFYGIRAQCCGHRTKVYGRVIVPEKNESWAYTTQESRGRDVNERIFHTLRRWEERIGVRTDASPFQRFLGSLIALASDSWSEHSFINLSRNADGSVDWCLDCVAQMTIRCGLPMCERPIFVGHPVIAYCITREMELSPHATVVGVNPRFVLGCTYLECARSGRGRTGYWVTGPGGKGRYTPLYG